MFNLNKLKRISCTSSEWNIWRIVLKSRNSKSHTNICILFLTKENELNLVKMRTVGEDHLILRLFKFYHLWLVILSFDVILHPVILHAMKTCSDAENDIPCPTKSGKDKEQTNPLMLLKMDVINHLYCDVQVTSFNSILFVKNNWDEEW